MAMIVHADAVVDPGAMAIFVRDQIMWGEYSLLVMLRYTTTTSFAVFAP